MLFIATVLLGGAAATAGVYSYRKLKESTAPLRAAFADLRDILRTADEQAQAFAGQPGGQYTTTIRVVADDTRLVVVATMEEMETAHKNLNQSQIIPLRQTAANEWGAFTDVTREDGVNPARGVISAAKRGPSPRTLPSRRKKAAKRPRNIWRSLKQAKDLVFHQTRDRQIGAMRGPEDGAARWQIAQASQATNHSLKVAASAVVVAAAGTFLFPPLNLVSGALILYASEPVFKGAFEDAFLKRRMSFRILDSVALIGLLAGGYFLICSITATIFHSGTKMMLKAEDRSRQILANRFGIQPRTVHILLEGEESEIHFDLLRPRDILVVHAGQMIPIDGIITKGAAAIDQHVLTGEAQPVEKGEGDPVFAATMLLAGRIEVHVEKTGAGTAAAQIREVLANSTDFRTAIQARCRDSADRTVLPTFGISAAALALLGPTSALAAMNSNYMAVMKVASPLGMLNFLERASQSGVLIKDGRALEDAGGIDTVVFDQTGALTARLHAEAKDVVDKLKKLGLTLYIISGDAASSTAALAADLGIDNYLAEVLPQDKSRQVERLQREGKRVCFVGDGINDAIALQKADVSISLRGASTLATDTAQIILMDESLKQLPQLFEVSYEYSANLKTLKATALLPSLVSLGGVFFLGATSSAALVLFNFSLVGGLINAIWPALQNRAEAEIIESEVVAGSQV